MAEPAQPLDLITMGHIRNDLYPLRTDVPLARVETFDEFRGDRTTDVAIAAAGLGRSAAVVTRTHDLDFFALRAARVLWIDGAGLGAEPTRSAVLAALKVRGRAATTVLGLARRPAAGPDPQDSRPVCAEALRHSTVAVGDLDACEPLTGGSDPRACAEGLLAAGVELAVVRLSRTGGVLAVHRDGRGAEVAPPPAGTADGTGAGTGADEAFTGCLVHGLLAGWELTRTVRHADAAAALVAARRTPAGAMPGEAEVEALLARV